ncbi:hypothetical protein LSAT2_025954 [Lamellibrachia satsuma]|nr:hypothetical protein LSAT2_025954 [Lamellibrachia satsuma]
MGTASQKRVGRVAFAPSAASDSCPYWPCQNCASPMDKHRKLLQTPTHKDIQAQTPGVEDIVAAHRDTVMHLTVLWDDSYTCLAGKHRYVLYITSDSVPQLILMELAYHLAATCDECLIQIEQSFSDHLIQVGQSFTGHVMQLGQSFSGCLIQVGQSFSGRVIQVGQSFSGCLMQVGQSFSGCLMQVGQSFSGHLMQVGQSFSGYLMQVGQSFSGHLMQVGQSFSGYLKQVRQSFSGHLMQVGQSFSGRVSGLLMPSSEFSDNCYCFPPGGIAVNDDDCPM